MLAGLLTAGPKAQESPAAAPVPVSLVLSKAATYVEVYASHLSGLVMEESYVQDVEQINHSCYRLNGTGGISHRQPSRTCPRKPEGSDAWMRSRVFEVDGKRFAIATTGSKLFSSHQIHLTGRKDRPRKRAKHRDIERTINLPFPAMMVLDRRLQPSFQFRITEPNEDLKLPKSAAFADRPGAMIVGFNETQVRTLITTPQGKNLRSHGRFWFALPDAEGVLAPFAANRDIQRHSRRVNGNLTSCRFGRDAELPEPSNSSKSRARPRIELSVGSTSRSTSGSRP
jgi:hypothetical protein